MLEEMNFQSIGHMLKERGETLREKTALLYKKNNEYKSLSYKEFYLFALEGARGLLKEGVKKGDKVAILAENSHYWALCDMSCHLIGAVVVPIYATNTPEQIAFILNNCKAKVAFVSTRQQYEKLLTVKKELRHLDYVFSFDRFLAQEGFNVMTIFQLAEISAPLTDEEKSTVLEQLEKVTIDDLATIIYTSGTTGTPKGVMLSHKNILWDAYLGIKKVEVLNPDDIYLSFLPLSHAFERTIGYYVTVMMGSTVAYAESIEKVPENVKEVRPTVMISVPRLFEKIYHRVFEDVHRMNYIKRTLFHKAVALGKRYVYKKYVYKTSPGLDGLLWKIANSLIFKKIRDTLGGRIRFFVSGGAPLEKTVNEFFWAVGLPILEGYGLTETSPAICINTFDKLRFGSVGTVFDNTEVKTDEDGELMVKGPMIMMGYYEAPEETNKILVDGWLKTGDIAKIDDEGYIFITDRKKEIIVTAGGKNIAPQPIENQLKLDKFFSQAYIYGDRKPYLVALIVPNFERLIEWARNKGISFFDMEDLVHNSEVIRLYGQRLADVNKRLARYETIKKYRVLCKPFGVETGELTPTLKMKRKIIYEKYKDFIEGLYGENSPDPYNGKTE